MVSVHRRRSARRPSSSRPAGRAGTRVDLRAVMAKPRKRQDDGDTSVQDAPAARTTAGNGGPLDPDRISSRAYELYLARGGSDGQDWDDWLAAERELTQQTSGRPEGDSGE